MVKIGKTSQSGKISQILTEETEKVRLYDGYVGSAERYTGQISVFQMHERYFLTHVRIDSWVHPREAAALSVEKPSIRTIFAAFIRYSSEYRMRCFFPFCRSGLISGIAISFQQVPLYWGKESTKTGTHQVWNPPEYDR